jgi:pimeloyl-ACP methyl ester carboxylesterase
VPLDQPVWGRGNPIFRGGGKQWASDRPVPAAPGDEPGGLRARAQAIPGAGFERIAGASHNLHHDEPEQVAALVERFLTA